MKNILSIILVINLISGCDVRPTDIDSSSIKEDWGTVKSTEFIKKTKHSIYYKITTDKFIFDKMDIKQFPNDSIIVGQKLFKQTVLNSQSANVSLCSDNLCQPHSVCYSWMPCFNFYEEKYPELIKE